MESNRFPNRFPLHRTQSSPLLCESVLVATPRSTLQQHATASVNANLTGKCLAIPRILSYPFSPSDVFFTFKGFQRFSFGAHKESEGQIVSVRCASDGPFIFRCRKQVNLGSSNLCSRRSRSPQWQAPPPCWEYSKVDSLANSWRTVGSW